MPYSVLPPSVVSYIPGRSALAESSQCVPASDVFN